MRITGSFLRNYKACPKQRELFHKLYPHGTTTTAANLKRAAKAGLTISWLELFVPVPAWKAYWKATAPAWKAYEEARATALAQALRDVRSVGGLPEVSQ